MTVVAELDDRIGKCQSILNTDPNSQIFAALAEALRKKGDLDKAFQACQNGLKIHPKYGAGHTIMAKINLDRGQYDWAEAELGRARELDGPGRATDVLLAEIYIYKGDFEEAIRILKTLLESDPGSPHIQKLFDIAQQIPLEREKETQARPARTQSGVVRTQSAQVQEQTEMVAEYAPIESSSILREEPIIDDESMITESDIIRQASAISGLTGCMLVNSEGLMVESKWNSEIDQELCAGTLSEVTKYLNLKLTCDSFGEVSWVLIETPGETIQLVRCKQGTFVFIGTAKIKLGPMRMKLTELFDRYQE